MISPGNDCIYEIEENRLEYFWINWIYQFNLYGGGSRLESIVVQKPRLVYYLYLDTGDRRTRKFTAFGSYFLSYIVHLSEESRAR